MGLCNRQANYRHVRGLYFIHAEDMKDVLNVSIVEQQCGVQISPRGQIKHKMVSDQMTTIRSRLRFEKNKFYFF